MAENTKAASAGRKIMKAVDGIIDFAVLITILLLVAVAAYAMWDSNQVYQAATAARYEVYKPTVETEGHSFEELREINPEVFAWLTVYGTHIDYPVAQSPDDNMKYVNTNAMGEYSLSGAIFLDCRSSADFSDFSSILYGHHMEKQAMFGEIGLFADKEYFEAREYGMLYYGGREHGLEFFAFVHADAYDSAVFQTKIEGVEAQQEYLELLFEMAIHTREIPATTDDRIVLLSTCSASSTNGRDILVGRITSEVYEDPYANTETSDGKEQLRVDSQSGVLMEILEWPHLPCAALAALLITLIPVVYHRGKRKKH